MNKETLLKKRKKNIIIKIIGILIFVFSFLGMIHFIFEKKYILVGFLCIFFIMSLDFILNPKYTVFSNKDIIKILENEKNIINQR
ncbi:hypothetical protein [Tenacibaculum ovolyticum]|uniref:hypothetical protein n=1 Tax=Tenacibaculum ovolyticum TaxID=104270 RepID=UPI0007EC57BA|nr:hypothetical protein [Tenacibaculum ovolyticum]